MGLGLLSGAHTTLETWRHVSCEASVLAWPTWPGVPMALRRCSGSWLLACPDAS